MPINQRQVGDAAHSITKPSQGACARHRQTVPGQPWHVVIANILSRAQERGNDTTHQLRQAFVHAMQCFCGKLIHGHDRIPIRMAGQERTKPLESALVDPIGIDKLPAPLPREFEGVRDNDDIRVSKIKRQLQERANFPLGTRRDLEATKARSPNRSAVAKASDWERSHTFDRMRARINTQAFFQRRRIAQANTRGGA